MNLYKDKKKTDKTWQTQLHKKILLYPQIFLQNPLEV